MNATLIAACTGATLAQAMIYAPALIKAMAAFGIDVTPKRAAMFLANVGHESGRLQRTVENLNYSVEALLITFGRHRISEEDARRYGRAPGRQADQAAIANCIYGGAWGAKNLGNTEEGDGARFIGRGLIQVTGRANVRAMRDALRATMADTIPDLVQQPGELAQPGLAAWSAAAFWDMRGLSSYADRDAFDGACDVVNMGRATAAVGDSKGFDDRLALFNGALRALA